MILAIASICPSWPARHSDTYLKKLTGNRDIEDSLERMDKSTQEEARMASPVWSFRKSRTAWMARWWG